MARGNRKHPGRKSDKQDFELMKETPGEGSNRDVGLAGVKAPKIAIVGRTNVGKSTLFNRLVRKNRALMLDTPGVTRDRMYYTARWSGVPLTFVDTGGLYADMRDETLFNLEKSVAIAVREADLILFMMDGRDGPIPADEEIHDKLRKSGKPFLTVINKLDTEKVVEKSLPDFYSMGVEKLYGVSAAHKLGVQDLMDDVLVILERMGKLNKEEEPSEASEEKDNEEIRLIIIGRTNVGKSTLMNRIAGFDRVVTSSVPGTTVDTVDIVFKKGRHQYRLIDTPGLRRRGRIEKGIEDVSVKGAITGIRKADIALFVIDSAEGITDQDANVAGIAEKFGVSVLILVNKWDVTKKKMDWDDFKEQLHFKLKHLSYADSQAISAKTGLNIEKIFPKLSRIWKERGHVISTGELNRFFQRVFTAHQHPIIKGVKMCRFSYATQVSNAPPKFLIFKNFKGKVHFSYQRYIINEIRKEYGFKGTPVFLEFRHKHGDED